MTVFVVINSIIDSGYEIYGVFDTREKAENLVETWDKDNDSLRYAWNREDFTIHELEVQ